LTNESENESIKSQDQKKVYLLATPESPRHAQKSSKKKIFNIFQRKKQNNSNLELENDTNPTASNNINNNQF
jgi:hypothetical protein